MSDDKEQELIRRIETLEEEVASLKSQIDSLRSGLKRVETSPPNPVY